MLIFTKSLTDGTLPLHWKERNITPIFKKGQKHLPRNYCPVSLTSVACKMMEKLVRNEVMAHMIRNNLHSSLQHGFVHGCSCTTQLLKRSLINGWKPSSREIVWMQFTSILPKHSTRSHTLTLLVKLAG